MPPHWSLFFLRMRAIAPPPPPPPSLSLSLSLSHGRCGGGPVSTGKAVVDSSRDALERKGPQRRPQKRLDRRLEEVAKAVGGGYCRLQTPLKRASAVRETAAGHRLGALEGGDPGCVPCRKAPSHMTLFFMV